MDVLAGLRQNLDNLFASNAPAPGPDTGNPLGSLRSSLDRLFGTGPASNPAQPRQGGMAPTSYKDPSWDASEASAARATGVPVDVLRAVRLHGERSNGNQVSPKGARGVYQFIPSTRDAFLKKYGVDAYSDDQDQQSLAAALHLKEGFQRTKDWSRALAGYNGGISGERGTNRTQENADYVRRTTRGLSQASAPQNISEAEQYDDAWNNNLFAAADDVADDDTLA